MNRFTISPDQNVIFDSKFNVNHGFVATTKEACSKCSFKSEGDMNCPHPIPCVNWNRGDGKNGRFEEINKP